MVVEGFRFAVVSLINRPDTADLYTGFLPPCTTVSVAVIRGHLLVVEAFTKRPVDALLLTVRAIRHLSLAYKPNTEHNSRDVVELVA